MLYDTTTASPDIVYELHTQVTAQSKRTQTKTATDPETITELTVRVRYEKSFQSWKWVRIDVRRKQQ